MKKLILHIGTEKTGTSTIQKFLGLNRILLLDQGFKVPLSTKENENGENQRWIPAFFYPEQFNDDFINNKFGKNIGLRKSGLFKKLEEFKNEIKDMDAKKCIISSEHLSSRLIEKNSIYNLKTMMFDLFDDLEILLYIRKPINHAISQISTEAKSGRDLLEQYRNFGTINFLNPSLFSKIHNIRNIIEKWQSVFTRDKLKIKIFDINEFEDNYLIKDFCRSCNIKFSKEFKIPDKINVSLNLAQFRYICYCNNKISKSENRKNKKSWIISRQIIQKIKSPLYLLPSKKEFNKFEDYFLEDINWIKRNFFKKKDNIWSKDKNKFRKEDSLDLIFNYSKEERLFLDSICSLE